MKQIALFEEAKPQKIQYNKIHRNLSTFKSGINKSVHSWFRLTPSFGPDLVRIVFSEFNYNNESIVLDPFSGAGTTLIESQHLGVKSYGFEINPVLYFIGKTSLNWKLSLPIIKELAELIENKLLDYQRTYVEFSCEDLPCELPTIHNVYRWWRPDVLKDMLLLKMAISESTIDSGDEYRDFFFVCLAGIIIPDLTNITLGRLQLHFIDRSNDEINVYQTFHNHLYQMIQDYEELSNSEDVKEASLFYTDSTELQDVIIDDKIDIVMTSPPYPNRYSYVWNTRPLLYFFEFFTTPREAADLDKKTIGGTWGTATSILAKGEIEPINSAVEKHAKPIIDEIRVSDNLMANYVMKYFNLLTKQIIKMDNILSENAKVAYVVGNTRIKGSYVATDEILRNIFIESELGYDKSWVNRFRKRNSGKDLFESIVYATK